MKLDLDNLLMRDLHDFLDMREKHNQNFSNWCVANTYAGADDQLDNDLEFLEKAFQFFNNRGYIK